MTEVKTYCLYCKKSIRGRADKKFCDADCRNAYHNELSKGDEREIRRVTNILRKNRKVLKALLGDARGKKAKKDVMMRRGFSFDYITQVQGSYRFCYEYGYAAAKNDFYMIVKGFENIVSRE